MAYQNRPRRFTKPTGGTFCGAWRQLDGKGVWYFLNDEELELMRKHGWSMTQILRGDPIVVAA